MVEEIRWKRLVYLGHKGDALAWRVEEQDGGAVLFIAPVDHLSSLVLELRVRKHLVGADSTRHAEMRAFLVSRGLGHLAGRFREEKESAGSPQSSERPQLPEEQPDL